MRTKQEELRNGAPDRRLNSKGRLPARALAPGSWILLHRFICSSRPCSTIRAAPCNLRLAALLSEQMANMLISFAMARRPDRERAEILSKKDLKELRYNLGHLSVTAVRDFYERAYHRRKRSP